MDSDRKNAVVHDCTAAAGGPTTGYMIYCPACRCGHEFRAGLWTFDGDYGRPTFSPSMLVRSGHYVPGHDGGTCWCTYNAEHPDGPAPFVCSVCHSFVRDGKIEFLSDCTHEMAGKTVDLEPF